jgi:hypothetical protein
MDYDAYAERLGDRIDGDVIVRRADAAVVKQIVVRARRRVDRTCDCLGHIGDHAHFLEADALHAQPARDLGDVLVLCPARQDLVADDDQRGGVDARRIGHGAGVRTNGRRRYWRRRRPPLEPQSPSSRSCASRVSLRSVR